MGSESLSPAVRRLLERGVAMPLPATVEVGPTVDPERIAPGVTLHPGCRVRGAGTSMGPGCAIGEEAPATVEDCQLGANVSLKGGFFAGSAFLDGASVGSSAHVRSGCLLEEEAGCAHAAGLKQTLLLSFVTGGSLLNFCDALMCGGTSRKDHSEIGSSYIHFNFTPHGDKATASLLGDVPRGVFLDQRPIFLGGQGGMIGPCRVTFGCVVAAGAILRTDALEENRLIVPRSIGVGGALPYTMGVYTRAERVIVNSLAYIGNVMALREWYTHVRGAGMGGTPHGEACHRGALRVLSAVLDERLRRMDELAGKLRASAAMLARGEGGVAGGHEAELQEQFASSWPAMRDVLDAGQPLRDTAARDRFLAAWRSRAAGGSHVERVRAVEPGDRRMGQAWLQGIVDASVGLWQGGRSAAHAGGGGHGHG